MATTPVFASAIKVGSGRLPATLDTSLTAPTNVTTIVTGAAAGTKIEELVFQGLGTTVAGMLNVFLYDGATYHLYDQVAIPAQTSSTTAPAFRTSRQYASLILPTASWTLRISGTIAGNQSLVETTATGGDLT